MSPLRILLADDHALVRAGLRSIVASFPDVEIVGETGDGKEAVRLSEQLQPDVVLMDVSMPGLNGLEATRRITRRHSRPRVVMLSMHADKEYVHQALAAGAAGYLLKNADPAELEMALRAVGRGEVWLSPAISRTVTVALIRGEETTGGGAAQTACWSWTTTCNSSAPRYGSSGCTLRSSGWAAPLRRRRRWRRRARSNRIWFSSTLPCRGSVRSI